MSTGSFGGVKQVPAFYNNFTKVIGNHTAKIGFYWNDSQNSQNSNAPDNGTYNFQTGGQNSTNNLVADMLLGRVNSYQQQNKDVPTNIHFHQVSVYAQDSWGAAPNLTVNHGIRCDHVGQWSKIGGGPGFQVFDGAAYQTAFNAQDYRPLQSYQNVYLLSHAPYSNSNSLQVSLTKQSGPVTFLANYTFSKVLGIRDGGSINGSGNGTGIDPFTADHFGQRPVIRQVEDMGVVVKKRTVIVSQDDGFGMKVLPPLLFCWHRPASWLFHCPRKLPPPRRSTSIFRNSFSAAK